MLSVRTKDRGATQLVRDATRITGIVLLYAAMLAVAFTTVGPFVLMLSASLTRELPFIIIPFDFLPNPISFYNFQFLFERTLVERWLLNSLYTASAATLGTIVTSSLAGYAFARGEFEFKNVLFVLFLVILMVPETAIIVPMFVVLSRFKWVNTYWALIGPWFASAFGTFFLRQQYLSIPRDYDDAARIDGASLFQIYYKVLLPQIAPGMATLAVLRFMGHWNAFLYPLLVTSRANMRTLPVGLGTVVIRGGGAGVTMAGAVMGFLPTFIIFLIGQKYIIQGIALSGIKG